MTCIVGIVDSSSTPRKVYMAADSGASDESIMISIIDPKIQRNGKYLIGYAGETGLGQLLHSIDLPDPSGYNGKELTKFLRTKFCQVYKNAIGIYSPSTSPEDSKEGGVLALIAVRGRLFEFDSTDFQFNEITEGAIGSGGTIAFGSLYTTRGYKDINKRLRIAVNSAIEYSPSCKGPIYFESI